MGPLFNVYQIAADPNPRVSSTQSAHGGCGFIMLMSTGRWWRIAARAIAASAVVEIASINGATRLIADR